MLCVALTVRSSAKRSVLLSICTNYAVPHLTADHTLVLARVHFFPCKSEQLVVLFYCYYYFFLLFFNVIATTSAYIIFLFELHAKFTFT